MLIWRGWGILAALIPLLVVGWIASVTESSTPSNTVFGLALLIGGVLAWLAGIYFNKIRPQKHIDAWAVQREAQLHELVETGQFSLGPGQPQPGSLEEARSSGADLLEDEKQQARGMFNRNTLFFIPMQWVSILTALLGLYVLVTAFV